MESASATLFRDRSRNRQDRLCWNQFDRCARRVQSEFLHPRLGGNSTIRIRLYGFIGSSSARAAERSARERGRQPGLDTRQYRRTPSAPDLPILDSDLEVFARLISQTAVRPNRNSVTPSKQGGATERSEMSNLRVFALIAVFTTFLKVDATIADECDRTRPEPTTLARRHILHLPGRPQPRPPTSRL